MLEDRITHYSLLVTNALLITHHPMLHDFPLMIHKMIAGWRSPVEDGGRHDVQVADHLWSGEQELERFPTPGCPRCTGAAPREAPRREGDITRRPTSRSLPRSAAQHSGHSRGRNRSPHKLRADRPPAAFRPVQCARRPRSTDPWLGGCARWSSRTWSPRLRKQSV
jgi:hypothetical protein